MTGRPRIAAVVTEYRPRSHADVIVTKLLKGYYRDTEWQEPRVDVVSLYTDQVPAGDLSRGLAAAHNLPISPTIAGALTLGSGDLAVDGVLLIGEHGDYPWNDREQKLYPRPRFFREIAAVMQRAGRSVPLFNDKHLCVYRHEAWEIYNAARNLGIPFQAGSSVPLAWRVPDLHLPVGCEVEEALAVGYGGDEVYGYHTLEMLQSMVERRQGGETGLSAVRCLRGEQVWEHLESGALWDPELYRQAVWWLPDRRGDHPRESVADPSAFVLEYRDGLRAAVLMLDGYVRQFGFAARLRGNPHPVSCMCYLQSTDPFHHFGRLTASIEDLFCTGRPQYPVERTLLTTVALDAIMESRHRGGLRITGADLDVRYRPHHGSHTTMED